MFEKFTRSASIGASYAGVLGDLVGLEARLEVKRISDRLRQRAIAVVLLLFGVVWLNIGVLVLIWDSPYRHLAPFGIGVALMLIAAAVWFGGGLARRGPVFEGARSALREDAELWGIDLDPVHVLRDLTPASAAAASKVDAAVKDGVATAAAVGAEAAEAAEPTVEQLQAHLRALRYGLRRSVVGNPAPLKPGSDAGDPDSAGSHPRTGSAGFHPKSRTMRTIMSVVRPGRGEGLVQQLPIKAVIALAVSGALRGRGRWLVTLWPILRLISAEMARSRRGARRSVVDELPRTAADAAMGPAGSVRRSRPPGNL